MGSEEISLVRKPVQPNETYAFDCTLCGECCRGDIRISLNLHDLWKMAKYLNLPTTGELFEQDWVGEQRLDRGGFRPYIRFKEKPMRFCPFLENRLEDDGELLGYCRLHPDRKPLVCSLAPLGRELELPNLETWFFTEPIEGCPGCDASKCCTPSQTIEPLREELELERLYFLVMETMQHTYALHSDYQRLHRCLRIEESVEVYIQRWMGELDA